MRRSEAREHIFKMVFGLEFNEKEEMPEQVRLYFEQLEQMEEKDKEYIQKKAWAIADHKDEIDTLINEHASGWKTTRMNKVDLTLLRLAVYEMKWMMMCPYLLRSMRQWNLQNGLEERKVPLL